MSAPPSTPRKDSADLNSLKVVELRAELSLRHLSPKGLKKDLVKRLADALERETGPAQLERALGVPRDDVDNEGAEGEDEGHDKEDANPEGEEGAEEDSPDGPGAGDKGGRGAGDEGGPGAGDEGGPGAGDEGDSGAKDEGGPDDGGAGDADAARDPAQPTAKDSFHKSAKGAADEPEFAPENSQPAGKKNAAEEPVADKAPMSKRSEPDQEKQLRKAVEQPSLSLRSPSPAKSSRAKGINAGELPAGRHSPAKDVTATSPQRTPEGNAKPAAAEDAAEQSADQQMAETEPAAEDATRKRGREPESAAVDVLPIERPRNENPPEPSIKRTCTEEERLADVQMTDAAAVASGPSPPLPAPVPLSDESVGKDCVGKASAAAASLGDPAGAQKAVPENAGGLAEAAPKKKRAFSPIKPPSPVKSSPPPPTTKSARTASASSGRSPGVIGTKGKAGGNEDASVERQSTSAPKFAESATIFILGLHRPFTNPALKRMLEEHGTVEYFWIDNIKSHCYVTFSDLPSAILARSQIHGTVWPPQTGHKLTVDFITTERMRALVEEEEKEQQARRRVRVVESADPDVVLVVEDISTVRHKPASFGLASTAAPPSSDATPGSDAARRTSGGGILSRLGGLAPPAPAQSSANAATAAAEQPHKDSHRHDPEAAPSWRNCAVPDSSARSKASAPKHVPPDQIFQKTETKPQLYYLPLTDKQIAEKLQCKAP